MRDRRYAQNAYIHEPITNNPPRKAEASAERGESAEYLNEKSELDKVEINYEV
jgi:hypothetical protein